MSESSLSNVEMAVIITHLMVHMLGVWLSGNCLKILRCFAVYWPEKRWNSWANHIITSIVISATSCFAQIVKLSSWTLCRTTVDLVAFSGENNDYYLRITFVSRTFYLWITLQHCDNEDFRHIVAFIRLFRTISSLPAVGVFERRRSAAATGSY